MKKKQIKALKQLAKQLPKSKQIVKKGFLVDGSDVSSEEKLNAEIPIYDDVTYKKQKHVLIEINHFNRLKSAYASNKEQGLFDYIEWLDRNNKRLNEMFEKAEFERVNSDIMNIVKKGVKGFWGNLIQFFLSFVLAFKTNEK